MILCFFASTKKKNLGSAVCLKASFDSLMFIPLSTIPVFKDEIKLDQGPIRSMEVIFPSPQYPIYVNFLCFLIPIEDPQGINLINGHHGDACGENFESSILSGPELRVMKPHLGKSEQIKGK